MRILLLAPHPYYIDRGTPIDTDILLRALSARGEEVDVVTYHQGVDRAYPNVHIHRIARPRWLGALGPGFSLAKLRCDVRMLSLVRKLVRRHHYDLVHASEEAVFLAMALHGLRGIPYIYDMDSSIAQQMVEQMRMLRPFAALFNRCEAAAIRRSIAAAPVCNALADLARKRGAPHVVTLHDISQLEPTDFMQSSGLRKQVEAAGPIVMYVGNLAPYQGVDLLLEAFAEVQQRDAGATLVIAGGPATRAAQYEAKARRLNIDSCTHFIGEWPADRLGALLGEADILVAPRIKGVNTPMKIFPYMHSGRPLVATDLPTHSQLLDESVAMLAPPEPVGLADAIIRLVKSPPLRRQLGEAGRAFVEREHTFPAHQHRVDALYNYVASIIKGGQNNPPHGAVSTVERDMKTMRHYST